MSIKAELELLLNEGHSTELRDKMINLVGSSSARMKDLMFFFFHEKMRYNQRISWAVGIIGVEQKQLIKPFLKEMVAALDQPKHDAIVRNTLRIIDHIDEIPEEIEGPLCDKCFTYAQDPNCAIAIRAYSITILHKMVGKYPELKEELIAIIKEHLPHTTAAFQGRGRKILKALKKG